MSKIDFNCLKILISGWIISYLLEIPAFPWTRTFPEKEKKKKPNQPYLYKLNKILWNVVFPCYGELGSSKAHPWKTGVASLHPEFLITLCPLGYRNWDSCSREDSEWQNDHNAHFRPYIREGTRKFHAQNAVVFQVKKPQTPEVHFPVRGKRKEHFALNLSNRVQIKYNKPSDLRKAHI